MILRRLRLKDYRKFRTLELEFPTGLIGIVGRNGSGKTTILEAVAFALYGSVASRTKAKGIRRDGAETGENCEVELEFALGGDPYRVVRSLRGETEVQQAALYRGRSPEPIAAQASGVRAAVHRLLGMDYPTFTRSVFSKQKEVNALSDARPEERRQAIRRMIGIDTITRAREAAKNERRTTEAQVRGARQALEALPSKRSEMKRLGPQVRTGQADVIEKAQYAKTAARTARTLRTTLKRLEQRRQAHTSLEKQVSGLAGDLRGAHRREQKLRGELVVLKQARRELRNLQPKDREFERVRRT
jgi:exonuclease SbcC